MIKRGVFLSIIFFLVVLPGCWPWGSSKAIKRYSGLVVINVLDKDLYDDCHIRGSIHVPFDQVERYAQKHIYKNAEIVLYCSNFMCTSSGFARKQLLGLGFKNVWAYEGGTAEWFQLGYPTDGPSEKKYLRKKLKAPPKEPYVLSAVELKKKIDEWEAKKG